MIYKEFGKTGVKISQLGFGAMRLPEVEINGQWFIDEDKALPLLYKGYEKGINYFDTAPYYCHKNSEYAVGKALKSVRKEIYLSSKCSMDHVHKPGDYRRQLEDTLTKMDTDYLDFYHFWALNKDKFDNNLLKVGAMKEALQAKQEGLIKHISFSFHDSPEVIKYILEHAPEMETALVQYNLLDRANEEMIKLMGEKGMGVVAMGPVAGGRLAAPSTNLSEKIGGESMATYDLALRFVLGNKNITCALSGMENEEMLENNLKIGGLAEPMNEEQWVKATKALEEINKFSELYCTGCNYCQPCPKNIEIPNIFKHYTYHNVYGLTETAKNQYSSYLNDNKATIKDCIDCLKCEKACPQKIEIRKELKRVEEILSNL